jgi:hypothetical protein
MGPMTLPVILSVGMLAASLMYALNQRRRGALQRPQASHKRASPPADVRRWSQWSGSKRPASAVTSSERRAALRRRGPEIAVRVAQARGAAVPGFVVDRSRTGLRLALPHPVAVGTALQLLAPEAPQGTVWVRVEAKHARPDAGRWLVGCSFTDALPWSVLLLFG